MSKDRMLNEDLFDTEEEKEIARLRKIIDSFKEYDKKRQEFYREKMERLEHLETLWAELNKSPEAQQPMLYSLSGKLAKYKEQIRLLNNVVKSLKNGKETAAILSHIQSATEATAPQKPAANGSADDDGKALEQAIRSLKNG